MPIQGKKGKNLGIKYGTGLWVKTNPEIKGSEVTLTSLSSNLYPLWHLEIAYHDFIPQLYYRGYTSIAGMFSSYSNDMREVNELCIIAICLQKNYGTPMELIYHVASKILSEYRKELRALLIGNSNGAMGNFDNEFRFQEYFESIGKEFGWSSTEDYAIMIFKEQVSRGFIPYVKSSYPKGKNIIIGMGNHFTLCYPRLFDNGIEALDVAKTIATRAHYRVEKT